ncbi:hypothetical protein BCR33DRAFT_565691 [Rhizoclosmatium globosum]|uniref:Uncharacterized protein n=1 Tax=Rhizoclosmatium globosum TaxID=329046 RepID=A0A1Y2B6H8_9FUNG|nr:hypothetical protein BCR33DRAFT_565691 [Rhizoclosmatium globosum]|eukprot:ORY30441.1 hypothetical protein BCR33DRAFT_565691 [Rhizoclosmatium globosum]
MLLESMSRKLFVDQKWTPISAVKFLPEGKDSYTDVEQIIMSAAVRVAAFNRNDADMLFTDTIHIPESVISLLPSGFISRNKKDVYGNPSSSDLLQQQQQHQQSYASSSSKGSLVKRLSKVFPKRSNSIHSKTSSMESVASLPQAQQLQPTHLVASKSSPLAKAQSLAALPSGLIQQPTILSLSTAPSIYHNPTTGQPLIARSVSSSGKFGIIQPLSSSVTAKQQELLGMQRVPPYPNATVRTSSQRRI